MARVSIVDDDDEQLIVNGDGQLSARVLDRSTGAWRELDGPDELVESYDPTDVFVDLAAALADAFPALAAMKDANKEPKAPGVRGEEPQGGLEHAPASPSPAPGPIKISAPLSANSPRHRDALIGGRILAVLGVAVAGLGIWAIVTAEDMKADPTNSELSALRSIFGWVLLGLAVMLVVLGVLVTDGGRGARHVAGVGGLGLGGLIVLNGLPIAIFVTPFFVSAYLLLRSASGRPHSTG